MIQRILTTGLFAVLVLAVLFLLAGSVSAKALGLYND